MNGGTWAWDAFSFSLLLLFFLFLFLFSFSFRWGSGIPKNGFSQELTDSIHTSYGITGYIHTYIFTNMLNRKI